MKRTFLKASFFRLNKSGLSMVLFFSALLITPNLAAQHSLEKLWATDTVLTKPESVLFDAISKSLFVSNIGDIQK